MATSFSCLTKKRTKNYITKMKVIDVKNKRSSQYFMLNKEVKRIAQIICSTIFFQLFFFFGIFAKKRMVQKISSNPIVASYIASSFQTKLLLN
jgi:hypothetical protein